MNTFGRHFRVTSFGESHGPAMGAVIDGCPSGVSFSLEILKQHLDKRRPGKFPWQTSRAEPDQPQVLSGVFENKTLGTPIAVIVKNQDARPEDYKHIQKKPRQGHADDLWKKKFKHYDPRGGGRASGRETISRVIGGSIAFMFLKQSLTNFQVLAFADQIGPFQLKPESCSLDQLWQEDIESYPALYPDKSEKIKNFLLQAQKKGESYGGSAVIYIKGTPQGLGQPVFEKLKSSLASALMGVGAVCGISIGDEIENIKQKGTQFHKNQSIYGGIRGGISTGEMIQIHVYFKPTSSIGKTALTGRHDPCIIPRAIPVLESMIYLITADHLLAQKLDHIKG